MVGGGLRAVQNQCVAGEREVQVQRVGVSKGEMQVPRSEGAGGSVRLNREREGDACAE